ncbi:MAG: C-terminal target protein [Candidatus Saccharibacteria bacterium]|nr:C-terminal target protein [Candidatus Saccharibacteria bacterium]
MSSALLLLLITGFGLIMTFGLPNKVTHGKKITNLGASADSGTPANPLPFDPASTATFRNASKKVFAHYMETYPISQSNSPMGSADYYDAHFVPPGLVENFAGAKDYAQVGGMWRERPLKRSQYPANVDWQTEDAKLEIGNATSAGIDGFAVDLLTQTAGSQNDKTLQALLKGATQLNNGFKIMLVPDASVLPDGNANGTALGDYIANMVLGPYGSAVYQVNGKVVMAPFYPESKDVGGDAGVNYWKAVIAQLAVRGIGTYFVPTFLTFNDTNANAYAPISEGMGRWGDASATVNTAANMKSFADRAHARTGKSGNKLIYLQPVRAQDTRPRGGSGNAGIADGTYWEANNSENLRNTWNGAIDNAEWVELMTWNDYAETSEIAPSTHIGYSLLDLSAYYIHRFKFGAYPAIKRDVIYVSNRDEFAGTYPPTKPTVQSAAELYFMKLNSGGPARNKVEVVSFLTAPQSISVTIGGVTQSYTAPAGQSVQLFDLKNGAVSASINYANGTKRVVNGTTVTPNPLVQDFMYRYANSARDGTTVAAPAPTPVTPTPTPTPTPTTPTTPTTTAGSPDLVVTALNWSPASPLVNDKVTFTATIKNQGTAATTSGIIAGVSFLVDGKQVAWSDTQTGAIAPGASVTVTANSGPTKSALWTASTAGTKTIAAVVDDINRIKNESNENNNTLTRVLTVNTPTPKPDLVLSDVTWSPASPKPGDNVTFSATVKNIGSAATPANTIMGVSFSVDGKQVSWSDNITSPLAAGASVKATADNGPSKSAVWPATAGTKTVLAFVDDINRIKNEFDETNNTLTTTMSVITPPPTTPLPTNRPDLVLTDLSWSPFTPKAGENVTFSATVKNQGTAATPSGTIMGVSFSVDGKQVSWSDGRTTSLAAGASVKLTANSGPSGSAVWKASGIGVRSVLAYVDDIDRIKNELDESNNTLTKPLTVVTVVDPDGPTNGPPPTIPSPHPVPVTVPPGATKVISVDNPAPAPIKVSGGTKIVVPAKAANGSSVTIRVDNVKVSVDESGSNGASTDTPGITIDTAALTNGVHTITITNDETGEVTTQKVIVHNGVLRDVANRVRTHAVGTGAVLSATAVAGLVIVHFHILGFLRRRFIKLVPAAAEGDDIDLRGLPGDPLAPGSVIGPNQDKNDTKPR